MINKSAENGQKRTESMKGAWIICDVCNEGVVLEDAGFDVEMHDCNLCGRHVADKADFFKMNEGVRALSK